MSTRLPCVLRTSLLIPIPWLVFKQGPRPSVSARLSACLQVGLANLGAYCDCGDLLAWRTGPCCSIHSNMALMSDLFSQLLLLEQLQTVQMATDTRPQNSQLCRRAFRAGDTVYFCRSESKHIYFIIHSTHPHTHTLNGITNLHSFCSAETASRLQILFSVRIASKMAYTNIISLRWGP